jgi:hypothetical protein
MKKPIQFVLSLILSLSLGIIFAVPNAFAGGGGGTPSEEITFSYGRVC